MTHVQPTMNHTSRRRPKQQCDITLLTMVYCNCNLIISFVRATQSYCRCYYYYYYYYFVIVYPIADRFYVTNAYSLLVCLSMKSGLLIGLQPPYTRYRKCTYILRPFSCITVPITINSRG